MKAGRGENGYSATIDIVSGTKASATASAARSLDSVTPVSASKTILDEIEEDISSEEPEEEDEEEAAPTPALFG